MVVDIDKIPVERFIKAAINPTSTLLFLIEFYYKNKKLFPVLPTDLEKKIKKIKPKLRQQKTRGLLKIAKAGKFPEWIDGTLKELGTWVRKNKKISDDEILMHLREYLGGQINQLMRSFRIPGEKTVSNFRQTRHGDCLAMSTVFGEIARALNYKIQFETCSYKQVDLDKFSKEERGIIEGLGAFGHAYVIVNNKQYDVSLEKEGTKHKGELETKKERAATIWLNQIIMLRQLERYEAALICYNIITKLIPTAPEIWYNRGNFLNHIKRPEEALESYNKAIKADPNFEGVWNNKAVTLASLGRYKEALTCMTKALELTPKNHPGREKVEMLKEKLEETILRQALFP